MNAVIGDTGAEAGTPPGTGQPADVAPDASSAHDYDPSISSMSQNANAGNLSAFGKRADQRGKGASPPAKPATGPPCPACHGHHPDLKTCPTHLARQDGTFKPTPGSNYHWCSGGVTCGGTNHFSRHHRAQWVAEHPGASLLTRPVLRARGEVRAQKARAKVDLLARDDVV